jgi:polar amino acid transport system permease protein
VRDRIYRLLFLVLFGLLLFYSFRQVDYGWNWDAVYEYRVRFLMGWLNTLYISLLSLLLSFLAGLLLSFLVSSPSAFLRAAAGQWVDLMRGTPLLVQILLFYYVIANAFGLENRWFLAILILSNFSAAYICEILRAARESIPRSQFDAARAMGFSKRQIFVWVTFPQMLKVSLPALAGQFSSIIKDSSLLSIIAVGEFTLSAQEINAATYSTLEVYIPLALGYLCLTLPVAWWAKHLGERLRYET